MPRYSHFFKTNPNPEDWGIVKYMNYDHGGIPLCKVLDGWKRSLEKIIESTNKEFSESHRRRAVELLNQYQGTGRESDHGIGRKRVSDKITQKRSQGSGNIGVEFSGRTIGRSFSNTQISGLKRLRAIEAEDSDDDETLDTLAEGTPGDRVYEVKGEDEGCEPPASGQPHENRSIPTSFYHAYNQMASENKWVLTSGRAVEDIIFTTCTAVDIAPFAYLPFPSFMLDTSDPMTKTWFTKDEWNEIIGSILPLPIPDTTLVDSLKRFFPVKSTAMLREVLDKHGYLPRGSRFDSKIHYDSQWADTAIRRFLMLLEAPSEPLRASHLEDWHSSYIWSSILDDCFQNIPGITIERKESPGHTTALCRNRHRHKLTTRMKLGPCLYPIIRTSGERYYEYGAMEVVRTSTVATTVTKWLSNTSQLVQSLHNMLLHLHESVKGNAGIKKRVQVVGVATVGLALQYVRLGHPGVGYVCLLQKEELVQIPKGISGGLAELLRVLITVAQLKEVIRASTEAVEERQARKGEVDLYEELVGWGLQVGRGSVDMS